MAKALVVGNWKLYVDSLAEAKKLLHEIGKKIVEEAAEVWMAAEHQSPEDFALEASQLIYHLQVMMIAKGISLDDLYRNL